MTSFHMRPLNRLLAPVDLEAIAWEALEYVGWLATRSGALVDIIFIQPITPGYVEAQGEFCNRLLTLLTTLAERYSGNMNGSPPIGRASSEPIFIGNMQPGDPVEAILAFAARRQHDVIVMGTRRPSTSLLGQGSVAEAVLHQADSPVLIIPMKSAVEEAHTSPFLS